MRRGLRRKACVLGISLGLLMALAGCGGSSGTSGTPPSNNPVPAISSISPTSATAGAAAQTLTINGSNFMSTSTVTYNAVAHAATYVSATQLTISLSASDQAAAGSYAVVVTNPTPGGGASNSVNFTVNSSNPVPAISGISPTSATAGAAAQTLTINGSSFLSTSTVTYGNVAHTATYVSATQLTISLSAADQATAGTYPVVVTNPAPGGGASNSVNFTVNAASSVTVTLNGSSSGTANETVGGTLPITASVAGATAALTFTVNDVSNGNSTFGTISGTYPTYAYVAPTAIPGGNNPVTIVATQSGTGQTASLAVTIDPSSTSPNVINIPGGATQGGINLSISSSTPTLGLAGVGLCAPTCSASVASVTISPGSTATLWLIGTGLTNSTGSALTSGLQVTVSQGASSDVTVSSVTPKTTTDNTAGLTNITFQVQVIASATTGPRNIIVTDGAGELQVFVGGIIIP